MKPVYANTFGLRKVSGPQGEILIPAVPAFVGQVDFPNRRITFHTIEGMLPHEN